VPFLTPAEIASNEIVDYCNSIGQDLMKDHEKRFADRIRAVKDASNSLASAANRFESSVKNAWGTMDKAATEYGTRLARGIQESTQRLIGLTPVPKFKETQAFHEESVAILNEIVRTIRKYLPKLHKGFKPEMAALNSGLAKLEVAVRALGETLEKSPGTGVETLQRDAAQLWDKQEELLAAGGEETKQASKLRELSAREQELSKALQELLMQVEFVELQAYEKSLRAIEGDIKQFFQPVTKPLAKLERAASAKQVSSVNTIVLHGLIEDPVGTISTLQSFAIVEVMNQLDEALANNRLDIEERKLRKARDTIQEVKNGAVENLREKYSTTLANIQETLRQLRAKGLLDKREELERAVNKVSSDRGDMEARHRDVKRQIDEAEKKLLKQKKALELQVSKLAGRTLEITTA
jgi:DNA-binding transcriptional ArsR family regulator